MFVLQGVTLRYYKVEGPSKSNVYVLLESLRRQGAVTSIGAELAVLENKHKRLVGSSSFRRGPDISQLQPHAEVILQDVELKLSESDYNKFYLHFAADTFRLRAETREDRNSWVSAFNKALGLHSSLSIASHTGDDQSRLQQLLAATQQGLEKRDANLEVQQYVESVLLKQQTLYDSFMTTEAEKRRRLLEHVNSLENEKRQLETSMVVEQELHNTVHRGSLGDGNDETRSELDSAASDAEGDADSANGQTGQILAGSSDDESADVWYECYNTLSRSSSAAPGRATGDPAPAPGPHKTGANASLPPGAGLLAAPSDGAPTGKQQQQQQVRGVPDGAAAEASTSGRGQEDADWLEREGPAPQRRTSMPRPAQAEKSVSLWSIIKECVGKDLSRVCLPVYFNEPMSALQRIAEELEYSELLDKAATHPRGSVERMLFVAAFAVSGYSGTGKRTNKPFNPLLGETFEFVCQEQGMRILIEKVVHHPTIIAAHAWGRQWQFAGDVDLRSKFWGRSIELHPVGVLKLTFADGDQYSWHKVSSSINNLIIGKIYIDHGGVMRIRNNSSGLVAKLKFHETGMLTRDVHQVKGFLEENGTRLEAPRLVGKWDNAMYAELEDGSQQLLWKASPLPSNPTRHNLTSYAMKLNEVTPGLKEKLAPTDCRLRPDQRATEVGEYDLANSEKQRLEKKQRAARAAADRGDPIRPRWFYQVPEAERTSEDSLGFKYKGGYWEARQQGHYEGCRDIFGPDIAQPSLGRTVSGGGGGLARGSSQQLPPANLPASV